MRPILFRILFSFFSVLSFAQQELNIALDSLYREDQIYVGVTYNALGSLPSSVNQKSFSIGFHTGIIRDFPINKQRNIAIGLGLGYSLNTFNHNIRVQDLNGTTQNYEIVDSNSFSSNRFLQQVIELPLELRWRSSTAESYKFWRVYTGFKLGYVLSTVAKFNSASSSETNTLKDTNNVQYGISLSVGYNTWNVHVYYGLNTILKDVESTNGMALDFNAIKIGFIFYLL